LGSSGIFNITHQLSTSGEEATLHPFELRVMLYAFNLLIKKQINQKIAIKTFIPFFPILKN
jgi:hypothetical protein